MRRLAGCIALMALAAALLPALANAAFDISDFQLSAKRPDGSAELQAGAHPFELEADVTFGTESGSQPLRGLTLHLPPGFLVNPSAVPECHGSDFHTPRNSPYEAAASGENCPNDTQVGVLRVDRGGTSTWFGLFNLVAPAGSVAAIGASPFGVPLVFTARVREGDVGTDLALVDVPASFDLREAELTLWGTPWNPPYASSAGGGPPPPPSPDPHNDQRGDCLDEQSGGSWGACGVFGEVGAPERLIESYLTLPAAPCGSPPSASVEASSWSGATDGATASLPALVSCNQPGAIAKVQLTTNAAAARTGLAFNVDVTDGGGILNPQGIARPPIKTAVASLPEGVTINPSLAAGLGVCDEAAWARETAYSQPGSGCPNESKIGTVVLDGVLGLPDQLHGSVYLAKPHANPFGTLLAIYMVARLPSRGLIVKSAGKIEPDPRSGRLVATFDDLPRILYTHFGINLREGQRSTLISPPACGEYRAGLDFASWADPAAFDSTSSQLFIGFGEGGGGCPDGGIPPFSPGLIAGSLGTQPAGHVPFYLHMTRTDGEQEITSYSATFPPGLLGKIAGVATCPDAAIAAAAQRSGAEEQANPSCPASSSIGHTMAGYGIGETLAWAPGGLYLAGPYHGAPLSLVAIDAAVIGPFDLGTVVVRQAIRIDRRSAQVSLDAAGSDPIPHILAGVPLHLRDIRVYVDRADFMVNPTSCEPMRVLSRLGGSGADLFDTADDTSATSTERYQMLGCKALGFKPGLSLRLRGSSRHGGYPSLRAVYKPHHGANLAAVSVTLPPSVFLAQEHIREVCTMVRFNAGNCPVGSVYGRARAVTPLMDEPLEGPVYLRSSRTSVPDLVADLRGRGIEIEVPGRIDSSRGGIRANFESLPDAPVSSFTMTLFGGKRGLIANAGNPCRKTRRANARFIAQSNETEVLHPPLKARCSGKHAKKKRSVRGHR